MTTEALTVRFIEVVPTGELDWRRATLGARTRLGGSVPIVFLKPGQGVPDLLIAAYAARDHDDVNTRVDLPAVLQAGDGGSPGITALIACGRVSPPVSDRAMRRLVQSKLSPPLWSGSTYPHRALQPNDLEEIVAEMMGLAISERGLTASPSGDQPDNDLYSSRQLSTMQLEAL